MITFLFKLLTSILLILSLILVLIGGLYMLSIELQWWLDVDVFHRLKMKVRKWAYAETKAERETMARMFSRRKGRGKTNKERNQVVKKRLFRRKDQRKTVEKQKNKNVKKDR